MVTVTLDQCCELARHRCLPSANATEEWFWLKDHARGCPQCGNVLTAYFLKYTTMNPTLAVGYVSTNVGSLGY